jgi:hypothetical protein
MAACRAIDKIQKTQILTTVNPKNIYVPFIFVFAKTNGHEIQNSIEKITVAQSAKC